MVVHDAISVSGDGNTHIQQIFTDYTLVVVHVVWRQQIMVDCGSLIISAVRTARHAARFAVSFRVKHFFLEIPGDFSEKGTHDNMTSKDKHIEQLSFGTRAIHAGQDPDPFTGAVIPPISLSTTFAQAAAGVHKGFEYSRSGNPTRQAFETAVASLERGKFGALLGFDLAGNSYHSEQVLHLHLAPSQQQQSSISFHQALT